MEVGTTFLCELCYDVEDEWHSFYVVWQLHVTLTLSLLSKHCFFIIIRTCNRRSRKILKGLFLNGSKILKNLTFVEILSTFLLDYDFVKKFCVSDTLILWIVTGEYFDEVNDL